MTLNNAALNIQPLTQLYSGFEITTPSGNNAFSYHDRQNRTIWVPPLIAGSLDDVAVGERVVFSEMEDGQEHNRYGLRNLVYTHLHGKDIFVCDNHNHAFCFWVAGIIEDRFLPGLPLLHVDQHSDLREPACYPELDLTQVSLEWAFRYCNFKLNVGNFIKPALALGLFSEVRQVGSSTAFEERISGYQLLDLDLDIFAPEMDHIEHDVKIARIRGYIQEARFITVATSPYFMEQSQAIAILRELFGFLA